MAAPATKPRVTPELLVEYIEAHRLSARTEEQLGDSVEALLKFYGITYAREHRLNARDRLDFLIEGGIALELKIQGSGQALLRQLRRYADASEVTSIIVVTTRARLCAMPAELGGKRIHLALQFGGIV